MFAGESAATAAIIGLMPTIATGTKSWTMSTDLALEHVRRQDVRGRRREDERVVVLGAGLRRLEADQAAGAWLVLHDDRLVPDLRQLLSEQPRHDVGRDARCPRHDQQHGLVRPRKPPAGRRPRTRRASAAKRRECGQMGRIMRSPPWDSDRRMAADALSRCGPPARRPTARSSIAQASDGIVAAPGDVLVGAYEDERRLVELAHALVARRDDRQRDAGVRGGGTHGRGARRTHAPRVAISVIAFVREMVEERCAARGPVGRAMRAGRRAPARALGV